jgi:hypothetical protein
MRNAKDFRRPFWHGSRSSNIAGILTQGLRIAPTDGPAHMRDGVTEYISPRSDGKPGAIAIPTRVTEQRFCLSMKRRSETQLTRSKTRIVPHPRSICRCVCLPPATSVGQDREWVNADNVHENRAGVLMPPPAAERGATGLIRRPRYHNEVYAYTSIHISGAPLLIMTVRRFQHTAGPVPVSCEGANQ